MFFLKENEAIWKSTYPPSYDGIVSGHSHRVTLSNIDPSGRSSGLVESVLNVGVGVKTMCFGFSTYCSVLRSDKHYWNAARGQEEQKVKTI